jgi:nitrite reductase/ring-hydroxylating ferredoxin subunit
MSGIVEFFKALAGISETRPLDPAMWEYVDGTVTVDTSRVPELTRCGGAVSIEGKELPHRVLVVRDEEGEFRAFSNRCTHMGRRLDPVKGERRLRCCSVSHSVFDYEGHPVQGPAKGSIQVHRCEPADHVLRVHLR